MPGPGTGAGPSRRPARARGTARSLTPLSRQPRDAAAPATSRRSRASSRPRSSRLVHTLVAVSTWNRISSCCTPGSPPSIRARSGPASTAAPADGSRSMNSSSTPSVIPPAARAIPDGSPGTVTSGPVPSGPGIAAHPAGLAAADLILPPMPGSPGSPAGPSLPALRQRSTRERHFANYSLQSAWFNNHPAAGPGSGPDVPTSGGRSAVACRRPARTCHRASGGSLG